MAENRSCGTGPATSTTNGTPLNANNGTVCIDTYRVLDSCRDRDCYEDVRIFLTQDGQEVLNSSCNILVSATDVLWANIVLNEVAFNDGFYQVTIKYYIKLELEGCMGTGRGRTFEGLAVLQKVVILYGGEGNASVFRSNGDNSFCQVPEVIGGGNTLPIAVVETIDPIALSSKNVDCSCECGYDCCSCQEIPEAIAELFDGPFVDNDTGNNLFVSLGLFSVIRIVRPAQILVNGTDYSVPDKECVAAEPDDPCKLFRSLAFPVSQFTGINHDGDQDTGTRRRGCCCNR